MCETIKLVVPSLIGKNNVRDQHVFIEGTATDKKRDLCILLPPSLETSAETPKKHVGRSYSGRLPKRFLTISRLFSVLVVPNPINS